MPYFVNFVVKIRFVLGLNFSQGFLRVKNQRLAQTPFRFFQIFFIHPTDSLVFLGVKGGFPSFHPGEINHSDMPMGFFNQVDIHISRGQQWDKTGFFLKRRSFAYQFHVQSAFFLGFPERGGFGIFVQFNMPPNREPAVQLFVKDEKDLLILNNEDGNREIDLFM
jgi:hypothetical protein